LARQCNRLVILGGPGSGKTWLAKRTARLSAEAALDALNGERDAGLDEVELPLYTTCARLISTHGDIRQAAASSALDWVGDLGGSRIVTALCRFFTERGTRTLLVIDSLDEASDPGEARGRLRLADSLRHPWRVVLTSRPSSWNNQLNIDEENQRHRVGELLPLRFPDDVQPVIQHWFAGRPERGQALAAQIARRPSLQQAATVPLILAFYCILGGQSLPEFRHKLYEQVINRMLRAPWRPGTGEPPDPGACRAALRTWAWPGEEESHPVSGVGRWEDDIPTRPAQLSTAGQVAVDHVAPPFAAPDFDTDNTSRRFVHRSIREHLVAEHVALQMSAAEAAGELLKHLWYDPDWEYAAPAALAMHPQRDWLLRELIRRVTGGGQLPGDLAQIDGCWEIRRFLARVAQESGEGDWTPEAAKMIGQARLDLAKSQVDDLPLVVASDWPTSNDLIIESLLRRLADDDTPATIERLVDSVVEFGLTTEEAAQARQILLAKVDRVPPWTAQKLADAVSGLGPTPEERVQARQALLARLGRPLGESDACELADAVLRLGPTTEERAQARLILLAKMDRVPPSEPRMLAHAVVGLDATPEERAQARQALLARLSRHSSFLDVFELADALDVLGPTAEELARARQGLLVRLAMGRPIEARDLAHAITRLGPTPEERAQARQVLLAWLARMAGPRPARDLAGPPLGWLSPRPEERLVDTGDLRDVRCVADGIAELGPTPEERLHARQALLARICTETDDSEVSELVGAFAALGPTAHELTRARQALLGRLISTGRSFDARRLSDAIARLGPTPEERTQCRQVLLSWLSRTGDAHNARVMAYGVTGLDPTEQDLDQARQALLALLAQEVYPALAEVLSKVVTQLHPTADQRVLPRQVLLGLLKEEFYPFDAKKLADHVAMLSPTVADLCGSDRWRLPPDPALLAAVRRNSGLAAWLAYLPLLCGPGRSATQSQQAEHAIMDDRR
jgi:hypothetical protein